VIVAEETKEESEAEKQETKIEENSGIDKYLTKP